MYKQEFNNVDYTYSADQIRLMSAFRKLWQQHVMWTRLFLISKASDLGDLDLVTNRLLRNPADFATVLEQFYGRDKADQFKKLLEQHLLIASELVSAAKAGKAGDVQAAQKKWYVNADEIANYLSEINPYWSLKDWKKMLYDHLKMTEDEAVARLTKQYESDITQYESIESQALDMADAMSIGIINQFEIR